MVLQIRMYLVQFQNRFLSSRETPETQSSWYLAQQLYQEDVIQRLVELAIQIPSTDENNDEKEKEEIASNGIRVLSRMLWSSLPERRACEMSLTMSLIMMMMIMTMMISLIMSLTMTMIMTMRWVMG